MMHDFPTEGGPHRRTPMQKQILPIQVAILDLYNGEPNQGMRCIQEMLTWCSGRLYGQPITYRIFETRLKAELPDLGYDLYLSTGGPGSPYDGEGQAWERGYFDWLGRVWAHNRRAVSDKKHVLFICHSFQLMCRYFEVAAVTKRRSESFGIFPVHTTGAGAHDPLFSGLADPFFAADFRKWQAVQPDRARLQELGGHLLAREKYRPHVPLERAVMALRISPELVGVQFHPEADPDGMLLHFGQPERREMIVRRYGEEKYRRILHRVKDPDYLARTHRAVLPHFLKHGIAALRPEFGVVDGGSLLVDG